ncbi:MAG TPA: sulfotransferase, partial [Caulobacteraceae bacterium]
REAHDAAVQMQVPADRLLVYRVGEGWERLCRFLDVQGPEIPFPHVNDADSFLENFPAPTRMA